MEHNFTFLYCLSCQIPQREKNVGVRHTYMYNEHRAGDLRDFVNVLEANNEKRIVSA
jgi:hypothetical protein